MRFTGLILFYCFDFSCAITVTGTGGATEITTDGGTLQMIATVSPSNASNKAVTWNVDNTSIATIDGNGLLTAVANGTVEVTASAKDSSGVKGTTTVTISNQKVKLYYVGIKGIPAENKDLEISSLEPFGATVSYQWQISNDEYGDFTDISGAIGDKYIIQSSDVGKYIRLQVTGTDDYKGTIYSSSTKIRQTYAVSFNSMGGTPSNPDPIKVVPGYSYNTLGGSFPTVTKDDHTFHGWFTEEIGGYEIKATSHVSIGEDHTLYARWIKADDVLLVGATGISGTGETYLKNNGDTGDSSNYNIHYNNKTLTLKGYDGDGIEVLDNFGAETLNIVLEGDNKVNGTIEGNRKDDGSSLIISGDGKLETQGSISVHEDGAIEIESGTINIKDGSLSANYSDIFITGGEINISGRVIYYAVHTQGKVEISGDAKLNIDSYEEDYGINGIYAFTIEIKGQSEVDIKVDSDVGAEGLYIAFGGKINIGKDAKVNVKTTGNGTNRAVYFIANNNVDEDPNGDFQIDGTPAAIPTGANYKYPESGVSVTGVSLNKASTTLTVGDTETLVATVEPENATNKTVTWESDNTNVATVDSNGKVTAVAAGNATITVTTEDGGKTATCTVTVAEAEKYTVTFSVVGGSGSISAKADGVAINSGDQVAKGSDLVFTAAPDEGYKIKQWKYNGTVYGGTEADLEHGPLSEDYNVTVEFEATTEKYTVTYEGNENNGGTVPTDATEYAANAEVTVEGEGSLTKENYLFDGWNTADDGTGTDYAKNDTFKITANTTLYAQWVRIVDKIEIVNSPTKYEYADGEDLNLDGLVVKVTYADAGTADIPFADFGANYLSTNFAHGQPVTKTEHQTLNVDWDKGDVVANVEDYKVYYRVTFDAQGGTVSPTEALTKGNEAGNILGESNLPEPTRAGYTFEGWFDAETEGNEVKADTQITDNMTIFARWTEDSTDIAPQITTEPTLPSGRVDASYSLKLEATGTMPITWSIEGSSPDWLSLSGDTISGTPTETGTFSFTIKATNDVGSDSKGVSILVLPKAYSVTVTNGTADKASASENELVNITANEPEAGKVFDKWVSEDVGIASPTNAETNFAMPAKDVTVKATYKAKEYTITVSNDGNGTGSANPATAEAGTEIALSTTPNSGYKFKEWQIISGGVTISNNKFTMPANDVEVKAIFEEVFVPITDITGVAETGTVNTEIDLSTATVDPTNATNQTITWSVKSGEATIADGNKLTATAAGTVTVTATITNGANENADYTKDFTITITATPTQADQFTEILKDVNATIGTEVSITDLETGITNLPAGATTNAEEFTPTKEEEIKKDITITFSDGSTKTVTVTVKVERIKISNVVAEAITTPVYGAQIVKPTFTVTEGSPAYFHVNENNGWWQIKEGSTWISKSGDFTPGTWRFFCQVRIDDEGAKTHKLEYPVKITVGETTWILENDYPQALEGGGTVLTVYSPEYEVTESTPDTYTVTYDVNSGTGTAPTETEKAESATFTAATATGITAPTGKEFKEWNTKSDGTGIGYAVGATVTMPAENLTLYAIWKDAVVTHTLTLEVLSGWEGGTITATVDGNSVNSEEKVVDGKTVIITVNPDSYKMLSTLKVKKGEGNFNPVTVSDNKYSFMIGEDTTIQASFTSKKINIGGTTTVLDSSFSVENFIWEDATDTLIMNDYTGTYLAPVADNITALNIKVVGTNNTLTVENKEALSFTGGITIVGEGKNSSTLTVKVTGSSPTRAIYVGNQNISVKNATLDIDANLSNGSNLIYGIYGGGAKVEGGHLEVKVNKSNGSQKNAYGIRGILTLENEGTANIEAIGAEGTTRVTTHDDAPWISSASKVVAEYTAGDGVSAEKPFVMTEVKVPSSVTKIKSQKEELGEGVSSILVGDSGVVTLYAAADTTNPVDEIDLTEDEIIFYAVYDGVWFKITVIKAD